MRSYKANGIIIKRDNFHEADRLVTLFTDRFGKVTIIAKGARRPKSRMASSTNLFCEIEFVAARARSIDILSETRIISSHCNIGSMWAKTKNAYWVGELICRLTQDEQPSPKLYHLLSDTLGIINRHENTLIVDYFIYHCLTILGYEPKLDECANSGSKLLPSDKFKFDPLAGGVIRSTGGANGETIDIDAIKAMRFLRRPWREVEKLHIPKKVAGDMHRHLKNFAETVLEREIKSDKLK